MAHSSMVLYRPQPSHSLTTASLSSVVPARLFSAQTGTAIATELLYRILVDIVNRLIVSMQQFASARIDQFSSYLEERAAKREQRKLDVAKLRQENKENGLGILDEVGKLAEGKRFDFECPMGHSIGTGGASRPPQPPRWVRGVLQGVEEGRMQERDFWIHTHGD